MDTLKEHLLRFGMKLEKDKKHEIFDKDGNVLYRLPLYSLGTTFFIECDILVEACPGGYNSEEFIEIILESSYEEMIEPIQAAILINESADFIIFENDITLISEDQFEKTLRAIEMLEEDIEMLEEIDVELKEMGASDEVRGYVKGLNKIALSSMSKDEYTIDDLHDEITELKEEVDVVVKQNKTIMKTLLDLGATGEN